MRLLFFNFIACLFVLNTGYAGKNNEVVVSNVTVSRTGAVLKVEYELQCGSNGPTSKVSLQVSTDDGRTFSCITNPEDLSGDVGIVNGSGKKTMWYDVSKVKSLLADKALRFKVAAVAIEYVPVTGIKLSTSSIKLDKSKERRLIAEVLPTTATDASIIWSSSNPSVAQVDDKGVVKALSCGEAKITAATHEGGKAAVCVVKVTNSVQIESYVNGGVVSARQQYKRSYPNNLDYKTINAQFAQSQLYDKGKRMRTWGIVLTSIGCSLELTYLIASIATEDAIYLSGTAVALLYLGPGIPLWVCGNKKIKQANNMAYAPAIEYPIQLGKTSIVPSIGVTNDKISQNYCMSAGIALRF